MGMFSLRFDKGLYVNTISQTLCGASATRPAYYDCQCEIGYDDEP